MPATHTEFVPLTGWLPTRDVTRMPRWSEGDEALVAFPPVLPMRWEVLPSEAEAPRELAWRHFRIRVAPVATP
jgi:hypothetical protein